MPDLFSVVRHPAFALLLKERAKQHRSVESDVAWLEGRLKVNPTILGQQIPNLDLPLPVYKTRCKDSCCNQGASGGWRIIYVVNPQKRAVWLVLLYQKKKWRTPRTAFCSKNFRMPWTRRWMKTKIRLLLRYENKFLGWASQCLTPPARMRAYEIEN